MGTEVLTLLDQGALDEELARAGEILRKGGLVAFPTETVYGIAVAADVEEAVERLYEIKRRDRSKPMTLMVADAASVIVRCPNLPPKAVALMKRFWPGALTLVLEDENKKLAGFRLPDHPLARGLVRAAGVPLLVPSANISDTPAAKTAAEVLEHFPTELDLIIDGGPAEGGIDSTVVKIVGDEVTVLRESAIPEWRIRQPHWANVLFVCAGNTDRSPLAATILRRRIADQLGCEEAQLDERGYRVESAGLAAEVGRRASRKARRAAREEFTPQLSLEQHRANKVSQEMVDRATHIICMERGQREEILAFFPHRERDVYLLDPEGNDVQDPAGAPYPAYVRLAKRLDAAATLIVGSILPA